MRRYADDDEVDLVVVGAGAGGSVLTQRLARAGWRVVCLDAGPFWDPDADWVCDERGAHTLVLDRAAPDRRRRPRPARVEQLRPRRRRLDGALRRLHPALSPVGLPTYTDDGVGADWPIDYDDLKPFYEAIEQELPVAGAALAVGRPAQLPAPRRTRSAATARSSCAARARPVSRPGSVRSRSRTGGSATGRTASTAASACRAARSTPRPAR